MRARWIAVVTGHVVVSSAIAVTSCRSADDVPGAAGGAFADEGCVAACPAFDRCRAAGVGCDACAPTRYRHPLLNSTCKAEPIDFGPLTPTQAVCTECL